MLYKHLATSLIALSVIAILLGFVWINGEVECTTCPQMRVIAPGIFEMGARGGDRATSPDELPLHQVTIANAYSIGSHQVTRGEFAEFVRAANHVNAPGCWTLTDVGWREDLEASWRAPGFPQTDEHPVVCVSQEDAKAYLVWLSDREERTYRLPTEAEWDFAARGAARGPEEASGMHPFWGIQENVCHFANVNDLTSKNKVARVGENCSDGALFTAPVASYAPNPNGLYDMIGNAWEWTADCAVDGYQGAPSDGSAWTRGNCQSFTLRGHSWTDAPGPVRIETRYALAPDARQSIVGFRVASDDAPAGSTP